MSVRRCGTCDYFRDKVCNLNPPVAALAPVRSIQGDSLQIIAMRPPVQAHEYCGAWVQSSNIATEG